MLLEKLVDVDEKKGGEDERLPQIYEEELKDVVWVLKHLLVVF